MKVLNTNSLALHSALQAVNEVYQGNIKFRSVESLNQKETTFRFTLTVENSSRPGARRSRNGRRIAAACWHVHGDFFDALFEYSPAAIIRVSGEAPITATAGNWVDRNIGSEYQPFWFSEACDC